MPVFTATLPVSASHPRRARHVRINFDFWITISLGGQHGVRPTHSLPAIASQIRGGRQLRLGRGCVQGIRALWHPHAQHLLRQLPLACGHRSHKHALQEQHRLEYDHPQHVALRLRALRWNWGLHQDLAAVCDSPHRLHTAGHLLLVTKIMFKGTLMCCSLIRVLKERHGSN